MRRPYEVRRYAAAGVKPARAVFVGARHCLAPFPHAALWLEGDACVAPKKCGAMQRRVSSGAQPLTCVQDVAASIRLRNERAPGNTASMLDRFA
jgi:hypothetical protein